MLSTRLRVQVVGGPTCAAPPSCAFVYTFGDDSKQRIKHGAGTCPRVAHGEVMDAALGFVSSRALGAVSQGLIIVSCSDHATTVSVVQHTSGTEGTAGLCDLPAFTGRAPQQQPHARHWATSRSRASSQV